jgi:hypothetical protein
MIAVFFNFVVHHDKFDTSSFEHFYGISVGMVALLTDYSLDTSIYYHHRAGSAWRHLAEKCGILKRYAESGSLNDRVLFSMKCAHAVFSDVTIVVKYFAHIMSNVVTVGQTRRSTSITGSHDPSVFDNHTTTSSTIAGSTLRNCLTQIQEVSIPIRSCHTTHDAMKICLTSRAKLPGTHGLFIESPTSMINAVFDFHKTF